MATCSPATRRGRSTRCILEDWLPWTASALATHPSSAARKTSCVRGECLFYESQFTSKSQYKQPHRSLIEQPFLTRTLSRSLFSVSPSSRPHVPRLSSLSPSLPPSLLPLCAMNCTTYLRSDYLPLFLLDPRLSTRHTQVLLFPESRC